MHGCRSTLSTEFRPDAAEFLIVVQQEPNWDDESTFFDVDNFWMADPPIRCFSDSECLATERKELLDFFDKMLQASVKNTPTDLAQH